MQRNRNDHLLPRGYPEGFTDPDPPGGLSVYNIEKREWFESGPRRVGASKGFYDYSPESRPDQTADDLSWGMLRCSEPGHSCSESKS